MRSKMSKLVCIAVFGIVVLCAGNVMAIPFGSRGVVDRNYNNSWNAATGTGTAKFSFFITDESAVIADTGSGVNVNHFSMNFDTDIFTGLSTSDITVVNPSTGWTPTRTFTGGQYTFAWSWGFGNPVNMANAPLELLVDYTLRDVAAYSNVSGTDSIGNWDWDEGQAWGLGYSLNQFPTMADHNFHSSGGSTAPVPEPGTIALLGIGLAGLVGVGMRKRAKNKIA